MSTAYCIKCETMVETEQEPTTGHVIELGGSACEPPQFEICDFPAGLAFTPPPELNIDEWMETAEPPTDEELAISDAEAELWTP